MGEDDFPQMPTLTAGAVELHEYFSTLRQVGFTRKEAYGLVSTMVLGNSIGASFGESYVEALHRLNEEGR